MRILIVLVPDAAGQDRRQLTMDRIAVPYYRFAEAEVELVMASPDGGAPLVGAARNVDPAAARFNTDRSARDALADTLSLEDVAADDFEAAFCIGRVGPLWGDQADGTARLLQAFLLAGKPVAMLPGNPDIEPRRSASGLLLFGEDVGAPGQAAAALLGILGAQVGGAS